MEITYFIQWNKR